jgi:hypothetical protein
LRVTPYSICRSGDGMMADSHILRVVGSARMSEQLIGE